jgi:nucleotide-binding universal stress UspA family protein
MKVLVAIDDSPGSRQVMNEIAKRSWPSGSRLIVMTAHDLSLGPMARPRLIPHDVERIRAAARKQAHELVEAAAGKLKKKRAVKVSAKAVEGSAARIILEEAERAKVDLVVLGSHGHSAWERLLLGSTAHSVVLHAPCSVEVVRKRKRSQ